MTTRALVMSVPFAAYLLALQDTDPADWAKPLIVVGYLAGPYLIGLLAGWRALPSFAGVYLVASILHQAFVWRDHPDLSGIDDIPPVAGVALVVPFLLVPMAFGAASRKLWLATRSSPEGAKLMGPG